MGALHVCLATLSVSLLLTSGQAASGLTLHAVDKVQPTESNPILSSLALLVCVIDAGFHLNASTVESRWTTPTNGEVQIPGTTAEKYILTQGSGGSGFESLLLIQNISYSDAGEYTCRVRDTRNASNRGPWIEEQLSLELLGKIHSYIETTYAYVKWIV